MKKYRKLMAALVLIGVLALAVPVVFIQYHSYHFVPSEADTLIVLGCRLYGDIPSPALLRRLEKALELYEMGLAEQIIVSGAMGPGETVTEAYAMKKYLVGRGVPAGNVHMEDRSYSTWENLKYSQEIMEEQGLTTAMLVSSDFHIFRSLVIARLLGISAAGAPAETPPVPGLRTRYVLREIPAFYREIIFR